MLLVMWYRAIAFAVVILYVTHYSPYCSASCIDVEYEVLADTGGVLDVVKVMLVVPFWFWTE